VVEIRNYTLLLRVSPPAMVNLMSMQFYRDDFRLRLVALSLGRLLLMWCSSAFLHWSDVTPLLCGEGQCMPSIKYSSNLLPYSTFIFFWLQYRDVFGHSFKMFQTEPHPLNDVKVLLTHKRILIPLHFSSHHAGVRWFFYLQDLN